MCNRHIRILQRKKEKIGRWCIRVVRVNRAIRVHVVPVAVRMRQRSEDTFAAVER